MKLTCRYNLITGIVRQNTKGLDLLRTMPSYTDTVLEYDDITFSDARTSDIESEMQSCHFLSKESRASALHASGSS